MLDSLLDQTIIRQITQMEYGTLPSFVQSQVQLDTLQGVISALQHCVQHMEESGTTDIFFSVESLR